MTQQKNQKISLTESFPELANQWHPTKNGNLKPEDVTVDSHKKVWWYLPYNDAQTGKHFDFEWQETVSNRTNGYEYPYLSGHAVWKGFNDLKTIHPEIAAQWHPTKNGNLSPENVTANSCQKVWWLLPYDDTKTGKHFDFEWKSKIADRSKGVGCPQLIEWKTEKLIRTILIELNIKFEEQKRFKETGRCSFDFYLPINNIIIEPDGKPHFTGWHADRDKTLNQYLKNDTLKNNFCLNNNIAILRIPYVYNAVKQESEIRSMVTNFIYDKQVPTEIIDFYSRQKGHNYHEIATKLNKINLELTYNS